MSRTSASKRLAPLLMKVRGVAHAPRTDRAYADAAMIAHSLAFIFVTVAALAIFALSGWIIEMDHQQRKRRRPR